MTLPDPSSLSPEEQALAQRLARLGPHGEPSPALDARVLAAAHAAAQAPAARPMVHRRRWPAVVGLAASLVLVVGLAWRLRLQPEPPPAPRQPVAAMRATAPAEPPVAEPAMAAAAAAGPEQTRREVGIAAQAPAAAAKSAPGSPTRAPAAVPPPDARAKATLATPKPMALPPPEPPPPPPEVILDSVQHVAAPAPPPPAAAAREADAGVAAAADADTSEAGQANDSAGMREGDEPSDEVPPATAESPTVRDAWLQRIHGLVDAGNIAGARASLREFVRRYPDYPLPEDLRALAR